MYEDSLKELNEERAQRIKVEEEINQNSKNHEEEV